MDELAAAREPVGADFVREQRRISANGLDAEQDAMKGANRRLSSCGAAEAAKRDVGVRPALGNARLDRRRVRAY